MEIYYKMKGVDINSIPVTPDNISKFGLHKRFESEIADIYCRIPKSKKGQFIIHIKDQKSYVKNNSYLISKGLTYSSVDWFETDFDEAVDYIKERL